MAQESETSVPRPRITIDVQLEFRRRLRLAAAQREVTVRQYVLDALEERLRGDVGGEDAPLPPLTAGADPVLAELWDNRRDAAYDRL